MQTAGGEPLLKVPPGLHWFSKLKDPTYGTDHWPENAVLPMQKQDKINREHINSNEEMPQHKTFSLGLEFIERKAIKIMSWHLLLSRRWHRRRQYPG